MLVAATTCNGPVGPSEQVELMPEELETYWGELEARNARWWPSIGLPVPELPPAQEVLRRVKFYSFPAVQGDGTSCYFNPGDWSIEIGSDKWASGCVPHELGHAALRVAGHPCKSYWEHEKDVQKCLEAMR